MQRESHMPSLRDSKQFAPEFLGLKSCRLYVSSAQFGTVFAPRNEDFIFEELHFTEGIYDVQGIVIGTRWN